MATREEANEWLASGGHVVWDNASYWAPGEAVRGDFPGHTYTLLADKLKLDEALARAEKAEARVAELEKAVTRLTAPPGEFWAAVDKARAEVETWPAWRRGTMLEREPGKPALKETQRDDVEMPSVGDAKLGPFESETLTPGQALDLALGGVAVVRDVLGRPVVRLDGVWAHWNGSVWERAGTEMNAFRRPGTWRRFVEPKAEPQPDAPKTLTAEEAEKYLKECPWRRVVDKQGDKWCVISGSMHFAVGSEWTQAWAETIEECAPFTIAPDESPPWTEVSAEDALLELRRHPDDEWEVHEPHYEEGWWIPWSRSVAFAGSKYRHRPRRKGA